MVKLTRFNGTSYYLNAELIQSVESVPDTIITLTTGKTIMVKESQKTVIKKILRYRRRINTPLKPAEVEKAEPAP
ncbi:MAG: flagellar FlbD family protein [Candidatus Riflebacteria bacterium]|nr:flagellar FlbD family protein [Candidatus Riflebacteria bacterium]